MLPRADLTAGPIVRGDAPAAAGSATAPLGDGRQELFQRSLAGLVGQTVQAEVLSKLTDGSYLVKIGDTAARLPLPSGVQVGGQVALTLVALTPRPTFEIGADVGGQRALATAEAAPAGARAEPLVYLDGAHPAPGAASAHGTAGAPAQAGTAGADASASGHAAEAALGGAGANAAATASPGAGAAATVAAAATPATAAAAATLASAAAQATTTGAGGAAQAGAPGANALKAAPAGQTAQAAQDQAEQSDQGRAAQTGQAERAAPTPGATADTAAAARAALLARAASPGAMLLAKAPLVPADQLPSIDQASTPATFSPAARVLASVLTSAAEGGAAQRAIVGAAPLADSAPAAPEKLAAALKDALGNSGLFYESHVAEWAAGQRPLAALAQEPQMRAAPDAHADGAHDPATAQFINLQLTSAEQGRVAWQGQAWPGQAMQWEVSRDAPERGRADADAGAPTPVWRSGLRLQFPLLGAVNASIVMRGDALHIDIASGDGAAGAQLRARATALSDAMAAAGLPLSSLRIRDAAPDASDVPDASAANSSAANAHAAPGAHTAAFPIDGAGAAPPLHARDHG